MASTSAGGELVGPRLRWWRTASAVAVGPSLVPVIVIVTVAVSVPPLPSVTV